VNAGVDDLVEVVRGDVRRHPDRNPAAAVDEQVREPRREHDRLLVLAVVGVGQIDGVLVDLADELHRQRGETRLGIALGRRAVVRVRGSEVAVPVDERIPQRELLGHAGERVVDGLTGMRVVLPHDLPHGLGRLLVLAVRTQTLLVHPVDDSALHGLETVARVGERSCRDDRHRVIQEGAFHLLLDLDGLDVAFECLLGVVRHRRQMSRNRTSLAFSWMK
jgi:hypothetical protein